MNQSVAPQSIVVNLNTVPWLYAPASCAAPLIIDRASLARTGALGLTLRNGGWVPDAARSPTFDRPWWPAPRSVDRVRPAPAPAPDPAVDANVGAEPDAGTADGAIVQP